MRVGSRTAEGDAATRVILSTFRANGVLLGAGDLLGRADDVTSAQWQVLGAIAIAQRPLTVPQIARRMGLTRQTVHVTVKRLIEDRLLERLPNTDHRRSQLVGLTDTGWVTYKSVDRRQARWVNRLAEGLGRANLETTARVLDEITRRLEVDRELDGGRRGA